MKRINIKYKMKDKQWGVGSEKTISSEYSPNSEDEIYISLSRGYQSVLYYLSNSNQNKDRMANI